jgi:transcriptional regulator with AAA-type ATPase domain
VSDFDDFEGGATARVAAPRQTIRIPAVELVVVEGKDRGLRATVQRGVARIGSAKGSDLALSDPTVSRLHCEIRVRADRITLRDPGSTNGTFVGGARIRDADVPAGTLMRVGGTTVRVDVSDTPAFVEISDSPSFGELVGASVAMRQLYAVLERIAPTDTTLLIEGETGTGKDVVARSLHAASRRKNGPFVPIDCGAIPESLFESELFGHVRGSFSGATSDRKGVFEEADGGTLFLDEIGEMPIGLQPKLLRAIETKTIRRVGSNVAKSVDVRIVAATNRDLAACVNEGRFREDLYYRLAVVEVGLPSLRERPEDVPVLAQHFFDKLAPGAGALPPDFLRVLSSRGFPGNVRELKNFVERSVSLGFLQKASPRASVAPPPSAPARPSVDDLVPLHLPLKEARQAWTERFEDVYLRAMLQKTGGNVTRAAELAGVSRRFFTAPRGAARRAGDGRRIGLGPDEVSSPAARSS